MITVGAASTDGETPGMFGPEPINKTQDEQHADGGEGDVVLENFQPHHVFRACNNICQTRPAAERGSDRKVRDEKQRTDNGEQSSLGSRRGIDATAIGKIPADNRIVNSDQTGESADRENDWQRRKPGGEESETDDISFARAPITIEQRGGAFPIDIPWAMCPRTVSND